MIFFEYYFVDIRYQWNITFTHLYLTYTLPPCSKEFIVVNPLNEKNNKNKNCRSYYKHIMKKHEHHFCGAHNEINLYPKDFNIEIIYHNSEIFESKSEFATLFQVVDHGLVQSKKNKFQA